MKKWIAMALAGLLIFGAFGCKNDSVVNSGDNQSQKQPQKQGTATETGVDYVDGSLLKVNVTETNKPFVQNGKSEYTVVLGSSDYAKEYGNLIVSHIKAATGCTLRIIDWEEETWSVDKKWIVVGAPKLFEQAGLSMPEEDIGDSGFHIKSAGDSVFIYTKQKYGIQGGALTFLYYTIGYTMYSEDMVKYHKDGTTMPVFDVTAKPDFEWHFYFGAQSSIAEKGMGYQKYSDFYVAVDGLIGHNTFKLLPPEEYNDPNKTETYHPEWFADNADSSGMLDLCFTAGGDAESYDMMVDELVKNMIYWVDQTEANCIPFSIQDGYCYCDCNACMEAYNTYGCSSAVYIKMANEIGLRLNKHYQDVAKENGMEARRIMVRIEAYHHMTQAPVKLVNGEYVPIDDSVKFNEYVCVDIAPIEFRFPKSIDDDNNKLVYNQVNSWRGLTDSVIIWMYETNFIYAMYPYDTWSTIAEYARFFQDMGTYCMVSQSQHFQTGASTAFHQYKDFLDSKLFYNVNYNVMDLKEEFFTNYFDVAKEPMMKFFDELEAHMSWLRATYPELDGYIYEDIENRKYWPKNMLDHWLGYIDEAYKAIEIYKNTDVLLYKTLKNHILIESIFPRFALVQNWSGMYSPADLLALKLSIKEDCEYLGMTDYSEYQALSLKTLWEVWGIA